MPSDEFLNDELAAAGGALAPGLAKTCIDGPGAEAPAGAADGDDDVVAAELGPLVDLTVQRHFTDDRRLDHYLVARLQEFSRSEIQRWIDAGLVTVNARLAKASHRVRAGDHLVIQIPEPIDKKPTPQPIPLEILFEDDWLVVLNKQANLIVHPGRGKENWSGTLTNGLQYHFDRLSTCGGATRPGIVHRLDRDTTGVIVVAKEDQTHRALGLQFEQRKVKKEYLAICHGTIARDRDIIDKPIGPHPTVREKMAIRTDPTVGRPAITFHEVIERFCGFTWVRLLPTTGRTHQLRVHLESIQAPIVADAAYSGRSALRLHDLVNPAPNGADEFLIHRQALHAYRLCFRHPKTGRDMDVSAPLPADMKRTLEALRQYRRQ